VSYLELLKLASPEAILVVATLFVIGLGLGQRRIPGLCSLVGIVGLAAAAIAIFLLPKSATLFDGMLVINPLNSFFKVICLGLAAFAIFLAQNEPADSSPMSNQGEYVALILLATIGLLLLVGSEELLMIFIGLELTGLSFYILTGFDRKDVRSAEAGLKYFLFGSTASAFTLFGLSLIYGMCGSTSLAAIMDDISAQTLSTQPLLAVGLIMALVGFGFKIAAAPFHLWAPDVYQAAPVSTSALIASASKVASFVVLGKLLLLGFGPIIGNAGWHTMIGGWAPVVAVIAAVSILIGNLVALVQSNVRRLLAYSAVGHAGYALLGIVAGTPEGFTATLFYVTIYAITLVGAFAVVGWVRRETGGDNISNFCSLARKSPLLAMYMGVFMLSLAGLPPLAGFFGKFYLFSAALDAGQNNGLLWLVAIALLGNFISLYYYLMVLKAVFVDEPRALPAAEVPVSPTARGLRMNQTGERFVIGLLAAAVLVLGVLPDTLLARIAAALP
jgi:NADH-quinone oxidoreductase subunit N